MNHGFKNPIPARVPDQYDSYCWFVHPFTQPNGQTVTVRSLFPPVARNDIYGGKTQTEIREMAFERLNELQRQYDDVRVEMVDNGW